jgi:hypothetical protein
LVGARSSFKQDLYALMIRHDLASEIRGAVVEAVEAAIRQAAVMPKGLVRRQIGRPA